MRHKIARIEQLLAAARAGKHPHGMEYYIDCPDLIETLHRFPIPYYLINQEHTGIATRGVIDAVRAAERCNAISIVKLNQWDPIVARDALDAGADGVLVPFIETGAQLREVIAACRFPPAGERGYCYVNRAQAGGAGITAQEVLEFWRFANEHALIIPMIESRKAVENIDDILASAEACPIFNIGPLDLALSMGVVDPSMTKPSEVFPSLPILYERGILGPLTEKLHAAGKLIQMPYMGPDPRLSYEELARLTVQHRNDLPYSGILDCLAVGVQDVLNVNKFFS